MLFWTYTGHLLTLWLEAMWTLSSWSCCGVKNLDTPRACRGTTCYLVQKRIDMLPKPLTEDICSLRSGVERLAFSVLWEMTDAAEIVAVRCDCQKLCDHFVKTLCDSLMKTSLSSETT